MSGWLRYFHILTALLSLFFVARELISAGSGDASTSPQEAQKLPPRADARAPPSRHAPVSPASTAWQLTLRHALHAHLHHLKDDAGNSMGNSGDHPAFTHALWELVRRHGAGAGGAGGAHVCEIGFNVGHSAATFLTAFDRVASYVAFDLCLSPSVEQGFAFLRGVFAGANFTLVRGDATETVPAWQRAHPHFQCDFIHVDGNHAEDFPYTDILRARQFAKAGTLLLVDDCGVEDEDRNNPVRPTVGFLRAVEEKVVRQLSFREVTFVSRGTCLGVFDEVG
jgi:hypothetical protein